MRGSDRRRIEVTSAAMAMLTAFGCRTEPSPSGASEPRASQPLCPDCSAGGETTDFAGSELFCCTVASRTALDLDDARAIALGAQRYVGWITDGFEGPFEWRRAWNSSRVGGYDAVTRLRLGASVQGVDYVDQEYSPTPSNPLLCPNVPCNDYLDFAIHLDLATEDGALEGAGDIHGTTNSYPDMVHGFAQLPIVGFSGTLDLGAEEGQPRAGGVAIQVEFSEQGAHGALLPWIKQTLAPEHRVISEGPLRGQWPVPSCVGKGPPVDVDAALASASGRTARELITELALQLDATPRVQATWSDGSATEVSVALAGEIERACLGGISIDLLAPLHLQTVDGRLDTVVPGEFSFRWDARAYGEWAWGIETPVLDLASLRSMTGPVDGVGASSEATLRAWGDAGSGSLYVTVNDGRLHEREYLRWGASGDGREQ